NAYYHPNYFGALGYKNSSYFRLKNSCKIFSKPTRENRIESSGKESFIIHHKEKYNEVFPFWVANEVMSFSELSKLFRNLLRKNKIMIIEDFKDFKASSDMYPVGYVRYRIYEICVHTMEDCTVKI